MKASSVVLVVASFIAGIAFIASCGGGGGSGSSSPSNADAVTPQAQSARFVAVDSTGESMGDVIMFSNLNSAHIGYIYEDTDTNVTYKIPLEIVSERIYPGNGTVYFEYADCSGTPYIYAPSGYLISGYDFSTMVVAGFQDYEVYVATDSTTTITVTYQSYRNSSNTCTNGTSGTPTLDFYPAKKIITSFNSINPPPYTVEQRY